IDTLADFYYQEPKNLKESIYKSIKKVGFEFQFIFEDLPYYLNHRKKYLQEKFSGLKSSDIEVGLASRIRDIEAVNRNAWKNYQIAPLNIDFTLFLAKRRTFFVDDFKTLGWDKYSRKIDRIYMPGEHANMLKPPHGVEFTRVLQKKLNQLKAS